MDLVKTCLDKQLVDRNGRPMGRVDGIVLDITEGRRPQVAFIEVGAVTRWRRVHSGLGRLASAIARRVKVVQKDPYRIPWSKVVTTGTEVVANVKAEETPALSWELWLRKKIVMKIPGA